jgi:hypothetical protein
MNSILGSKIGVNGEAVSGLFEADDDTLLAFECIKTVWKEAYLLGVKHTSENTLHIIEQNNRR